jgi:hypothetical protein
MGVVGALTQIGTDLGTHRREKISHARASLSCRHRAHRNKHGSTDSSTDSVKLNLSGGHDPLDTVLSYDAFIVGIEDNWLGDSLGDDVRGILLLFHLDGRHGLGVASDSR